MSRCFREIIRFWYVCLSCLVLFSQIITLFARQVLTVASITHQTQAKLERETERADLAEKSYRSVTEELNQLSISTEAEKRELRLQAGEQAQHTERQRNEEFKKLLNEKEEAFRMLHDKMDTTVREMQAKIDSYEEANRKLLKEKFY